MTQPPRTLSLGKAIGWSIAFMLLGFAVVTLLLSVWAWATHGDVAAGLESMSLDELGPRQTLIVGMTQLLGFGFATWVVGVRRLGLGRAELRLVGLGRGFPGLGWGLALGAAAAVAALLLAVLVAGAGWSEDAGGMADYLGQVAKTTLVLAPAALSEEVIFRGVPLVLFALAIGRGTALVVVSGIIFALLHGVNPGVTVLGLGNIALAGIFLGVAFYTPGGLWAAFGAHLGWNATLAALDAPVSGLPYTIPYIDYHAGEPAWLSGGQFGPEGGLLATLSITVALLLAARWTGKDRT